MITLRAIVDRAVADPDFFKRLAADLVGTLDAEGYEIPAAEIKALLGMSGASDQEVAKALQARLGSHDRARARAEGRRVRLPL